MDRIERIEILQVDLAPKVARSDAIQSFVAQETPIVRITCADGAQGIGYSYTIGTGGSSVVALLRDHLAPRLVGRDAAEIDTALWDLKCRRAGRPLWQCAGGAQPRVPVYTTEGGWLHHSRGQPPS